MSDVEWAKEQEAKQHDILMGQKLKMAYSAALKSATGTPYQRNKEAWAKVYRWAKEL